MQLLHSLCGGLNSAVKDTLLWLPLVTGDTFEGESDDRSFTWAEKVWRLLFYSKNEPNYTLWADIKVFVSCNCRTSDSYYSNYTHTHKPNRECELTLKRKKGGESAFGSKSIDLNFKWARFLPFIFIRSIYFFTNDTLQRGSASDLAFVMSEWTHSQPERTPGLPPDTRTNGCLI